MSTRDRAFWEQYCAMQGAEEVVFLDGHDDAILGVTGEDEPRLVYAHSRILDALIVRDGMSHSDAMEWIDFNIASSAFGAPTPIILYAPED